MDCTRARELMHDFLDGALSETGLEELNSHLESCAACAAMFDGLKKQSALLHSLRPESTPVDMLRLKRMKRQRQAAARKKAFAWAGACAAALAVCVLSATLFLRGGSDSAASEGAMPETAMVAAADEAAPAPMPEEAEAELSGESGAMSNGTERQYDHDAAADAPAAAAPAAGAPAEEPAAEEAAAEEPAGEEPAAKDGGAGISAGGTQSAAAGIHTDRQTAARIAGALERQGFLVNRFEDGAFSVYADTEEDAENIRAALENEYILADVAAGSEIYVGIV